MTLRLMSDFNTALRSVMANETTSPFG